MKYCIDTTTLIDLKNHYPMDVFPRVWEKLSALIGEQRLISPIEVKFEIEKGDDDLVPWVKEHKDIFVEVNDAHQDIIREVVAKYPVIAGVDREPFHADPWIITVALYEGRLHKEGKAKYPCAVLTEERFKHSSFRIPNVCKDYGIACFNRLEFFRNEKWQF